MRFLAVPVVFALGCGLGKKLPEADRIEVSVHAAGTPAELERSIVGPLETALVGIDGVEHVRTEIRGDRVTVRLIPRGNTDLVGVVHERLLVAAPDLPRDIDLPVIRRVSPGDPTVTVVLSGASVEDLARAWTGGVVRGIETVPGVREIVSCGVGDPELAVEIDPSALASRGVPLTAVVEALRGSSTPEPDALADLAIAPELKLRDLARVERTMTTPPCLAWNADGHPVAVGVIHLADRAVRGAVTDAVQRLVLPATVVVTVVADGPAAEARATGEGIGSPLARATGAVVLDHRDGRLTVVSPSAPLDALATTIRAVPGVGGVTVADSQTVRIVGPEADVDRVRDDVQRALAALPGVSADRAEPPARPSLGVEFDRQAATRLGLSVSELLDVLQLAVHGLEVTSAAGTRITLRLAGVDPERLGEVVVPTSGGTVPLGQVFSLTRDEERDLLRVDGQRAVELAVRGGDEAEWDAAIAGVVLPVRVRVEREPSTRF